MPPTRVRGLAHTGRRRQGGCPYPSTSRPFTRRTRSLFSLWCSCVRVAPPPPPPLLRARMGRPGRVTSFVGPEAQALVADTLSHLRADETFDGVFSRKRSYRKSQKKRVERLELAGFEPTPTNLPPMGEI